MFKVLRPLFAQSCTRLSCCCWGKLFTSTPASRLRQVAQCCVAVGLLSLASIAPGQSLMHKVAHLQVVVVKAVWGIFNNTNGSIFTS